MASSSSCRDGSERMALHPLAVFTLNELACHPLTEARVKNAVALGSILAAHKNVEDVTSVRNVWVYWDDPNKASPFLNLCFLSLLSVAEPADFTVRLVTANNYSTWLEDTDLPSHWERSHERLQKAAVKDLVLGLLLEKFGGMITDISNCWLPGGIANLWAKVSAEKEMLMYKYDPQLKPGSGRVACELTAVWFFDLS